MQQPTIQSYAAISTNKSWLDGKVFAENSGNESIDNWLRLLYEKTKLNYPKFFKMDNLSKMALLAMEMINAESKSTIEISPFKKSIFLANKSSSKKTDELFLKSCKSIASPSLFVYTLPSICIGEVCIKHKIKGPNSFLVAEKFDPTFFIDYTNSLFKKNKTEECYIGWVENDGNEIACFLYKTNDNTNGIGEHNLQNIQHILNIINDGTVNF